MKAVILAAGEGVRCRPLTFTRSKVMLPVANRPIVEYVINSLVSVGITDIIFVVNYQKERIKDYFNDGVKFNANIEYVEQKNPLGTAHALLVAKAHVCADIDIDIDTDTGIGTTDFLVLNGDNIIEPDTLKRIIESPANTILTSHRESVENYGVLITEGKKVKQIIEKPKTPVSRLVNTGIYRFSSDIFEYIEQKKCQSIPEVIQNMIDGGIAVQSLMTDALWMDVIHSWDLLDANARLLPPKSVQGTIEAGATIKGDVSVGEGSIIHSGCYIVGPVVIGKNCRVGPNSVILPSTSIGDSVTISSFSEIKNSVIMNNTRISSHTRIESSIIGSSNFIDSHFVTQCGENLMIAMGGILHKASKLGTVTGDDCKISPHVTTCPGVMIGSGCDIGAGNVLC